MATVTTSIGTDIGSVGAGTVTTINGNATVEGSGTDFTVYRPGQYFAIDDGGGYVTYTIASITDADTLVLTAVFAGTGGAGQAYKIGLRSYSTMTLWEADNGGGDGVPGNDNCTGECYADLQFSDTVTVNFGANLITLTAADGEETDGTAGSGVINDGKITLHVPEGNASPVELSRIEVVRSSPGTAGYGVYIESNVSPATVERMLIHDVVSGNAWNNTYGIFNTYGVAGTNIHILNNIIYSIKPVGSGSTADSWGISCNNTSLSNIYNNTIWKVESDNDQAYGVGVANLAHNVKNNIAMDTGGSGGGVIEDFDFSGGTTPDSDYNMSSDATADDGLASPPGNCLLNKASADQFISTSPVVLLLKSGADAIDAGTDLGTTPTGVNYDIDNRDRDAEGDTWDIGADEYVAVGGAVTQLKPHALPGALYASFAGKAAASVPLAGTIAAQSSTVGVLEVAQDLVGASAAQSSVTGVLEVAQDLVGTSDAQSSVAGVLEVAQNLAGVSAAQSSVSGVLEVAQDLVGASAAQSSVTGVMEVAQDLTGISAAQSSLSGILEVAQDIVGASAAQSSVTGALTVGTFLSGAIAAQSSMAGVIEVAQSLAGVIAAQSAVSGAIEVAQDLAGVVSAQSAIAGVLELSQNLAGVIEAQSSLAGILEVAQDLAGVIGAQSALNGILDIGTPLKGIITSQSATAGAIEVAQDLVGVIGAQSATAGILEVVKGLAGTVGAQSSLTGALISAKDIAGIISAQSALSATLTRTIVLNGVIEAQSALSARMLLASEDRFSECPLSLGISTNKAMSLGITRNKSMSLGITRNKSMSLEA